MALRMITDKVMGAMARQYQSVLGSQLSQYGLRYEDLLIEEAKEVQEALELASPETQTARTRRIKRAIDLSYKKKSMNDYAPGQDQETFKEEIYADIKKIRSREQEYAQLNAPNKM